MSNPLEKLSDASPLKPIKENLTAIQKAIENLTEDEKKAFANALGVNIQPPDQTVSNKVWLIIIWAFVSVMVGAAVTLCASLFIGTVKDGTKPETILTVFTTVTAFLAGLFAPSPLSPKK